MLRSFASLFALVAVACSGPPSGSDPVDPICGDNQRPAACAPWCGECACSPGYADCNGDPTDGCEVRLDTDDNCGACGFGCDLLSPAHVCNDGLCEVDSAWWTGESSPRDVAFGIVSSNAEVFWLRSSSVPASGAVVHARVAGDPAVLAGGLDEPLGLIVTGDYAYFSAGLAGDRRIYRVATSGGAVVELAVGDHPLIAHGGRILFRAADGVRSMAADGSDAVVVAAGIAPAQLAAAGDELFASELEGQRFRIYRAPVMGGSDPEVVFEATTPPELREGILYVDDRDLYLSYTPILDIWDVERVDLDTGDRTLISTGDSLVDSNLVEYAGELYFFSSNPAATRMMRVSGDGTELAWVFQPLGEGLVWSGEAFYWTSTDTVHRFAIPPP